MCTLHPDPRFSTVSHPLESRRNFKKHWGANPRDSDTIGLDVVWAWGFVKPPQAILMFTQG